MFRSRYRFHPNPVISMKDISYKYLDKVVNYMHAEEISILEEDLIPLAKAAKDLKIRGLSEHICNFFPNSNTILTSTATNQGNQGCNKRKSDQELHIEGQQIEDMEMSCDSVPNPNKVMKIA